MFSLSFKSGFSASQERTYSLMLEIVFCDLARCGGALSCWKTKCLFLLWPKHFGVHFLLLWDILVAFTFMLPSPAFHNH